MIAEDDLIQGDDVARALAAHGAKIVMFSDVQSSLGFLKQNSVDVAVLDVRLGGQTCYPIAGRLLQTGTAFVFLSGNEATDIPEKYKHLTYHAKPCSLDDLAASLV